MKIMLHAVDCQATGNHSKWHNIYEGLGDEGYHRVMAMMKAFPPALIESYAGTPGCRNKEVHFEYFAEEKEIDFQWRMKKEEFNRLMYPHDMSSNYCGSVHFGDCKLEFVFENCGKNEFVAFNNLYVYGKNDGYANLDDGTPYSFEDDMFSLQKLDDFDKWKAECEKQIVHALNNDKNYLLRDALEPTKVDEWYPRGKWYMTVGDASRMVAKALIEDRTKVFSFSPSDALEAKENPKDHGDDGPWYGIKRIDGFFDNDPDEFIVAVGYYGGGECGFAHEYDGDSPDVDDCSIAVRRAINEATGLNEDNYIYIEEEEKKEEK